MLKLSSPAIRSTPPECKGYYIYQLPIRIWHWSMALAIVVLVITGYIIGKPLHSITGDATFLFYMGYVRLAHFIAGYVLVIGLFARIVYTFFSNKYAKELLIVPVWKKAWWQDLWLDIRWYLFLNKAPTVHMGHNPLAQVGMFSCVLFLLLMSFTGLAIYQEEASPWYLEPFRFMINLAYATGGNTIDLHNWHRLGMKLLLGFIIVHLYMVIREEIMGRTTLMSTMFSGYREIRDGNMIKIRKVKLKR